MSASEPARTEAGSALDGTWGSPVIALIETNDGKRTREIELPGIDEVFHPAWSPDGRQIAFISDKSGEEEVWLINQDGSGKPEQLTQGGKAMRYAPEWAPDGKSLAYITRDAGPSTPPRWAVT